jgi:PAS domain S-box-containing protein
MTMNLQLHEKTQQPLDPQELAQTRSAEADLGEPLSGNGGEHSGPKRRLLLSGYSTKSLLDLQASEERYRTLVEHSNEAIIVAQDGTLKYANATAMRYTGRTSHELSAMPFLEVVHPDDRSLVADRYVRRLRGEDVPAVYDFRLIDKNGRVFWVEIKAVSIIWDGAPATLSYLSDITERRRAENKLREERNLLRTLIDNLPDAVYAKDDQGRFVLANEVAASYLGAENVKQLLGKTVAQLPNCSRNGRERLLEEEVVATGAALINREETILDHDGSPAGWLLTTRVPLIADDGSVAGLMGIERDITESKLSEEILHHSLQETARGERLLLVLSRAAQAVQRARSPEEVHQTIGNEIMRLGHHVAICMLDGDGRSFSVAHTTLETALIEAAERLAGFSLTSDSFPIGESTVLSRVLRDGEPVFTNRAADLVAESMPGRISSLSAQTASILGLQAMILCPLAPNGAVEGMMVVAGEGLTESDLPAMRVFANQVAVALENARLWDTITRREHELRALSGQLVNAQEAERKRISRELHDELGQALTSTRIDLLAVSEDLKDCGTATHRRLTDTILVVEQMLKQVREMALDLRPSMLDDLGLVPTLSWHTRRFAERTGVKVSLDHSGMEVRLPSQTETTLYRTVQEALTNISKHAQATNVGVHLERVNSTVRAIVEDDGRGFDPHAVQARHTTERGVGLVGMRERVVGAGGSLTVNSAPGRGTRLTLTLPLPKEYKN